MVPVEAGNELVAMLMPQLKQLGQQSSAYPPCKDVALATELPSACNVGWGGWKRGWLERGARDHPSCRGIRVIEAFTWHRGSGRQFSVLESIGS
jgi:hypothetical protein